MKPEFLKGVDLLASRVASGSLNLCFERSRNCVDRFRPSGGKPCVGRAEPANQPDEKGRSAAFLVGYLSRSAASIGLGMSVK